MHLKSSDLRNGRTFPLAALPLIALLCTILISRLQIFLTRKRREIGELAWGGIHNRTNTEGNRTDFL